MSAVEAEPYEPGQFQYDFDLLESLKERVKDKENTKDSNKIRISEDIDVIFLEVVNEQKDIFLRNHGKDPRYLKIVDDREKSRLSPFKFDSTLIDFFNSLDMGTGPSGTRFQETPEFEVFFKDGFGTYSSLISLYNIWFYKHRLDNLIETKELHYSVKLTEEQKTIIAPALEYRISRCKEKNKLDEANNLENGFLNSSSILSMLIFYKSKNSEGTSIVDKTYNEKVYYCYKLAKTTYEDLNNKIQKIKNPNPRVNRTFL
jgi:hypothetical protein